MEVTTDLVYQGITLIFFILTVYFANGLVKARKIAGDMSVLLKETAETMDMIGEATADNQLTSEELAKISLQARENLNVAITLIDEIKALAGLFFRK